MIKNKFHTKFFISKILIIYRQNRRIFQECNIMITKKWS